MPGHRSRPRVAPVHGRASRPCIVHGRASRPCIVPGHRTWPRLAPVHRAGASFMAVPGAVHRAMHRSWPRVAPVHRARGSFMAEHRARASFVHGRGSRPCITSPIISHPIESIFLPKFCLSHQIALPFVFPPPNYFFLIFQIFIIF